MNSPSHIPSLEGLRAISIILVFFSHAGFGHIIPGGFGVTIFFFLSGYLITTLLCREWDRYGSVSFGAFYIRRALRLSPPIAVTLLVSFVLVALGMVEGHIDKGTLSSQIFFYFNYYALYAETSATVDGLGVLWSLSVEEHFYLIWPAIFLLVASGRIGLRSVAALSVVIFLWRCIRFMMFDSSFQEIYTSTDTRFDSLLYGCLLALMSRKDVATRLFPPIERGRWLIAVALAALIFTFVFRDETFRSTLRYSVQGLALMPLFYYAVTFPNTLLFRPLNWPVMRQLGVWSYTTYLIHFVVIKGLVFNGIASDGSVFLLITAGILSIAFAALVYKFIETPLHPLRRRVIGHPPNL
jgi:peptidoglycan/LPS O-acetylase OafA/YrhL